MLLILMGPRCAGKTSVGVLLARRLGWAFVDMDTLTVEAMGASSTTQAWAAHGQEKFRMAEAAVLAKALRSDSVVLALGGGTPTAPGAAELLRAARESGSVVVYLRATAATLRERMALASGDRPSITGPHPVDEVEQVLRDRGGLYESLASAVVDVDALTTQGVCAAVMALLPGV